MIGGRAAGVVLMENFLLVPSCLRYRSLLVGKNIGPVDRTGVVNLNRVLLLC